MTNCAIKEMIWLLAVGLEEYIMYLEAFTIYVACFNISLFL